ncbi:MAG: ASCH domain-containing protein, partial [Pseudomonadota bacterium]
MKREDLPEGMVTFQFMPDQPEIDEFLIRQVIKGEKTATCMPAVHVEQGLEQEPVVGRQDVALDHRGQPVFKIETVSLFRCAFKDVPEEFALAEGEGPYEQWEQNHRELLVAWLQELDTPLILRNDIMLQAG